MMFAVSAVTPAGPLASVQAISKDALHKLLEFRQLGYEQIVVRNKDGRIVSTDEWAALYTVSETSCGLR